MNVESASVIGIKFIQFEAGIRILNEAINQSEERMLPPIEIRDAGGEPVFARQSLDQGSLCKPIFGGKPAFGIPVFGNPVVL